MMGGLRASGLRLRVAGSIGILLLMVGCLSEPKKIEAPKPEGDPAHPTLKIAYIPAARLKADDLATQRRLEEAVGIASSLLGLDAVVFGGDSIANDSATSATESLDAFGSLAGIIAAKRYAVLGERERAGVLPRDEVLRVLEKRKLVPDRNGSYSEAVRPGARILVLDVGADSSVSPETRKFADDTLRDTTEPMVVVVADRPPLDKQLLERLRGDVRVKAILFRGTKAEAVEQPGDPLTIAAAPLDAVGALTVRVVELDELRCKVRLVGAPGATDVIPPQTLPVRQNVPSKAR